MADYSVTSPSEEFGMQFNRMAGQIRCAMPGVIQSFDPVTQTATVQPAIKMRVNIGEGVKQMDMPPIDNVPVVLPFAQGAGFLLTLPIKAGDECLIVFSDRSMDNFMQSGGVQPTVATASDDTTTPRAHSLSDAICIPGIISNPQAVPEYSTDHIELRDKERKQYLSLGPEGITITDGTAKWNMKDGKVTLDAPAGIQETSKAAVSRSTPAKQTIVGSNIRIGEGSGGTDEIENTLKSRNGTFIDQDNVNLNSHIHTGVETGGGNTQEPLK